MCGCVYEELRIHARSEKGKITQTKFSIKTRDEITENWGEDQRTERLGQ